jgi:hypothetical protein
MSDPAIHSTTQEFLDVYDIVNDMVLLKDGTASIILRVGTMNFSLLAEQEQDAVIFTYGSLLNSLNYPIQISIQSQTKDATKYLRLLDEQIEKTTSDRKAILIKKYRNFVAQLIKERNVLEKKFYIIVPATPSEMGLMAPSSVLPGKTAFDITTVEKSILLEKAANILEPRHDHLTAQFNRLGLFVSRLNTQEIIQNFYINYNPEAAEGQEIAGSDSYTTPLVRASFGKSMLNQTIQDTQAQMQQQSLQQSSPPQAPITQIQSKEDLLQEIPIEELSTDSGVNSNINFSETVQDLPPVTSQEQILFSAPEENAIAESPAEISPTIEPLEDQISSTEIFPPSPDLQPEMSQPLPTTPLEGAPTTQVNLTLDSSLLKSAGSQNVPNPIELEDAPLVEEAVLPQTSTPAPIGTQIQESVAASSETLDFSEDIAPLQDNSLPEPTTASENIPAPVNIFTDNEEDLTKSN